ncbi:MAG: thiopurine S-methyltransferase [gamma proteobacterium symbiont of Lucinoma myriamae]|nr:thiopurine S-methyltransferase [gamma proteobacterium symbiont of Lucinoma myriamae]MCU7818503.1 thiopurine S-methyltransferase [gamma proteobacterium symbiont of Lucinoma myriamae]MCU7832113.1 thiopurine S-methyltransferase [gamma proteobacterium symbiont of Lucinoma myriamae]
MHHSFWHQRWQEQHIGFHLDKINPYLSKYWHRLEVLEQGRVFVPLCGKSHDLLFLHQQSHKVVGNELSCLAVQDFYTEQQLNASKTIISSEKKLPDETALTLWSSPEVDIYCGDFFALKKDYLSYISAVYDRAALVALPREMRENYVKKMLEILPQKVKILLLTLDYDENEKQGPPFSVTGEEVYRLYSKDFSIELLEVADIAAEQRSPRSQNMSYFNERVFLLTRVF